MSGGCDSRGLCQSFVSGRRRWHFSAPRMRGEIAATVQLYQRETAYIHGPAATDTKYTAVSAGPAAQNSARSAVDNKT